MAGVIMSTLLIAGLALTHPDVVYAEALSVKPEILSQQLRLKGTEHSINIAKAGHYPKLNFSAGMGTNYYNTNGYESRSFGEQLKNNFSQSLGLNLSVPIFNRFIVRNQVRSAKVDRETQQLELDNTKKRLYKEIHRIDIPHVGHHALQRLIYRKFILHGTAKVVIIVETN